MDDLLKRLREEGLGYGIGPALLCQQAAQAIATLTKERDEARAALKPFAAFNESLKRWSIPESWARDQEPWPSHLAVVRRTYPASADARTIVSLYPSDFDRAAKAMENSK